MPTWRRCVVVVAAGLGVLRRQPRRVRVGNDWSNASLERSGERRSARVLVFTVGDRQAVTTSFTTAPALISLV